ncbi:Phage portal protein, SPP1 Gp6-like [Actinopolyspora alba]|uniref:Phage portal protein, SPP1 Gp6-like n=1 Tax=Actinopolyspora alba TaxID=673379 RepID=A0A1I2BF77_9ACTN|nr:phage portal protein [Actinopolyspora alba]SFE54821.1 Phage portal protein, SPP1 Gp6-like [Actinopolyspora alba]
MATEEQARQLVTHLEAELLARAGPIELRWQYYRGEQPLKFASEEFQKYHGKRYQGFSDNWVQVTADSPVERLTTTGIKPAGAEQADADLWRVWQENSLDADSQLGFLSSVVANRSYVLVWGNPDDESTPVVTFEDARSCVIAYEPGSRRKRRAALRRWQDGDVEQAVLYLPDEVWKFERSLVKPEKSPQMTAADADLDEIEEEDTGPGPWQPREMGDAEPNPQPNPMGVVPVVELPNRPMLVDEPISDVSGVIAMQDAINLLWAQLFTASDYASFPQRIVLGAERPTIPQLNNKGEVIAERPVDLEKFAVDRVLWVEGDDAKIAEWSAANLDTYTSVMEVAVGHIAAQTRTPQHYLIGKLANLSGDALIAAETGLVQRVNEKQLWFGQALREMFRLVALAQGNEAKAKAVAGGSVLWADAESRSQSQMADALQKLRDIGFPFEWLALRYGLTPTEVADVMAMKQREAQVDPVGQLTQMMSQQPGTAGSAEGLS